MMKPMNWDMTTPPEPPKTLEDAYALILALWQEVATLRQENATLRAENEVLRQDNARLRQENAQLHQQVADLQERLRLNSSNSSQPPSADRPQQKAKQKPSTSTSSGANKRRGAQPGHPGARRELLPVEEVDAVVDCEPPLLCPCGGSIVPDYDQVMRHQVWEIPPQRAQVTEFRLVGGRCANCGRWHSAVLPVGVSWSWLGPRAEALVADLGGEYHLSKPQVQQMLANLWQLPLSTGTISAVEERVSEVLSGPVAEAHTYVQQQVGVYADETGLPQRNGDGHNPEDKKGWLWVAVTTWVTVFVATLSRGKEAAKALLGENFAGWLGSDRWGAYNWVDKWFRQLCWAHLKREFTKIAEREGEAGRIGTALLAVEKRLFALWHRVRDGTLKRSSFRTLVTPLRRQVRELLAEAASWPAPKGDQSARAKTARTCRELLKLEPALWLFVRWEGVEPTNNTAEQALRSYVLWRKCSYGTQSQRGSQFVARIMTVTATCRQQGRSVLDYLTAAITAHRCGERIPSLLPVHPLPAVGGVSPPRRTPQDFPQGPVLAAAA